jgi:hypothetical protein
MKKRLFYGYYDRNVSALCVFICRTAEQLCIKHNTGREDILLRRNYVTDFNTGKSSSNMRINSRNSQCRANQSRM